MLGKVKRIKVILLALLVAATPMLSVSETSAASATLSLAPGSTSVAKGATVSLGIYVNGDEPVSVVKANLTYPSDKLDYVGVTNSGAFEIVAGTSGGNGSVAVDRGTFAAKGGRSLVATVRFRAKVDAGTANVAISSGDVAGPSNTSSNWLRGSSGANLTFKVPAAPTPAAPEPPKDTTPPTIENASVTDIKHDSVTVTWTTSEPSTSTVDYGLTDAYGFTATDPNLVTEHKVVLNSPNMQPGIEYHYLVKSADGAGNVAADSDKVFKTKGATVVVTVTDKKNKPLKGAVVTIGSSAISGTTDGDGKVTVDGLQIGKVLGVVEYKGEKSVVDLEIKPISADGPQTETFSVETPGNSLLVWVGVPLVGLLALLGLAAYMLRRNGRDNPFSNLKSQISGAAGKISNRNKVVQPGSEGPKFDTGQTPKQGPSVVKPTITLEPTATNGLNSRDPKSTQDR